MAGSNRKRKSVGSPELNKALKTLLKKDPVARFDTTQGHTVYITYTKNDDGLWLRCSCGWERNLGYEVSVGDAAKAHREHVKGG